MDKAMAGSGKYTDRVSSLNISSCLRACRVVLMRPGGFDVF
jgi:hypothetical protein